MTRSPIVKAMVAIRRPRDGALLVSDDIAPDGEHYQRPLGGRVESGERAADTVRRELREETGQEITDVRLVGVLENRFQLGDIPGHEIVLLFSASFAHQDAYEIEEQPILDHRPGSRARVLWRESGCSGPPLVPAGIVDMIGL